MIGVRLACCFVLVCVALVGSTACGASNRRLVWSDEFDGVAGSFPDPSSWTAEVGGGGWGNDELETYTQDPANVALDGTGHLVLTARATGSGDDGTPTGWTSARITTFGKRTFTFGRIEVRAKVPAGPGLWPAAWTLGQNISQVGWPACGEIDVIESVNAADTALQTAHGPRNGGTNWFHTIRTPAPRPLSDDFHVYSADWTADRITFAVDGQVTGSVTPADVPADGSWPFTAPQYLLLNLAVGGRLPGPPTAATPRQASMTVDWIRVYAPA